MDEIAVERLVMGVPPVRSSRAERQEAVRVLSSWCLPDREIAARIGVSERTVVRLRSRSRVEGLVAA